MENAHFGLVVLGPLAVTCERVAPQTRMRFPDAAIQQRILASKTRCGALKALKFLGFRFSSKEYFETVHTVLLLNQMPALTEVTR